MSKRLTDSELDAMSRRFPTHLGEPPGSVKIQEMITELRERRASDLTEEEREALRWVAQWMRDCTSDEDHKAWAISLAALDKILGGKA